jgi:hypothetical protein
VNHWQLVGRTEFIYERLVKLRRSSDYENYEHAPQYLSKVVQFQNENLGVFKV